MPAQPLSTVKSQPAEPVAQTAKPEPPTVNAPDISIHDTVRTKNIVAVKQHLAAGTDVNAKEDGGWAPLHYAAGEGHKEIAELLIDKGADVNTKDDTGRTPLHWVAFARKNEIVELLIANDADVNAKDNEGKTPLYFAELTRHKAISELLRKHGAKTGEELKAAGN